MLSAVVLLVTTERAVAIPLVCSPGANSFSLVGCNPANTATCVVVRNHEAPGGCALDFGAAAVTLRGDFDVGTAALRVTAGSIRVEGALRARSTTNRPGGAIALTANGDVIVSSGRLDVSGDSAGQILVVAGRAVDLQSAAAVVARGDERGGSPNAADGGTVAVRAGTSLTQRATFDVTGQNGGRGGSAILGAGTDLLLARRIDAGGGEGGDVDLFAEGDLTIQQTVDVSATAADGDGGAVDAASGGRLTVLANLTANASGTAEDGGDGGAFFLAGGVSVSVASSATLRAVGAGPDGTGGVLAVDAGPTGSVTQAGDATLAGPIVLHGAGLESDGGAVEAVAAGNLTVSAAIDVTGGRAASGGDVELTAGTGRVGTLTLSRSITAGAQSEVVLAGCRLDVRGATTVNAGAGGSIDLLGRDAVTLASGSRYLAAPGGSVTLVHPPGVVPATSGATFDPPRVTDTVNLSRLPACPVCGDGVVQPGEICDDGNTREDDCCNATCTAIPCATATPAPGAIRTATPATTATPQVGATATPGAPGPTATPAPGGSTPTASAAGGPTSTPPAAVPTATPAVPLPLVAARTLLACERALAQEGVRLAVANLRAVERCGLGAFTCLQANSSGPRREACLAKAARRCEAVLTARDDARAAFTDGVAKACGGDPAKVPLAVLLALEGLAFDLAAPACLDDVGLPLTSLGALSSCIQIHGECAGEQALTVAMPRLDELLGLLFDVPSSGLCVAGPVGAGEALAGASGGRAAARCQRVVAVRARAFLGRALATVQKCVDASRRCQLAGKSAAECDKVGRRCRPRLAALGDPVRGPLGRLLAGVARGCGALPAATLFGPDGVGFDRIGVRCRTLGVPALDDARDAGICVAHAYGCAATSVLRRALPRVDGELAAMGLDLGVLCPATEPTSPATSTPGTAPTPTGGALASATATPSVTASPSELATATATATATPAATPTPSATLSSTPPPPVPTDTPSPLPDGCGNGALDPGEQCDLGDRDDGDGCSAACRFELLVPGGGGRTTDCFAEWAVINPTLEPILDADGLPSRHQACRDGDPRCDADHDADGVCRFRVAVCLAVADPALSDCDPPGAIASYTLQRPRPTSRNPITAANGQALLAAFARLSTATPGGRSGNVLAFVPPLAVGAPDDCTALAEVAVPLEGRTRRVAKLRSRIRSADPGERRDRDALALTCLGGE